MAKRIVNAVDHHVAAQIRIQRKARGLSQTELGKALGVSYQQIQKYENGKNRLGASRLQQIATVLDVTPDFFFEGETKSGVSSPKDLAVIDDFIFSRDGVALSRAFTKITDAKMRRRIVSLVEHLAEI